ncbi:MAG TPA: pyridoxamine 5'-phosphate oxidase family protein [Gaiellaceae bacterium]|nr:pyridoxamine 5'-phosphate oxidase family protein [Gaiellaceae bacterium]
MSKLIGDTLPDDLFGALDGRELGGKVGPAYLLVTADEDGTPRPCMLSAGEVLALDGRRLRFALWKGSRTCANLVRGGRALFCHVAPRTVVYVRGPVRTLEAPETNLDCFELQVDSVESDDHTGMPVTSGITFAVERGDPAAVVEAWERQLAGLRAAS